MYEGGVLIVSHRCNILSTVIFFLNLGGLVLYDLGVSGVKIRVYCRRSNRVREKL
jgi:hypothetical protein